MSPYTELQLDQLHKDVEKLEIECNDFRAKNNQLRQALLGLAKQRQFGNCWCDTIAKLYCVAQPKCEVAKKALME